MRLTLTVSSLGVVFDCLNLSMWLLSNPSLPITISRKYSCTNSSVHTKASVSTGDCGFAFFAAEIIILLKRIHYLQALGCDLISRIYHYGNFKAETRNERLLESVLNELQLYPTTENDILQRQPIPENLNNNQ